MGKRVKFLSIITHKLSIILHFKDSRFMSTSLIMPPKKKIRLIEVDAHKVDATEVTFDHLNDDIIALIFRYFEPVEIMHMRRVCKKCRDAVKKTIPAPVDFFVSGVNSHRAMVVMAKAIPNLQQIDLCGLNEEPETAKWRHALRGSYRRVGPNRYSSGDDPFDDPNAEVMHDINIISNFSKLRSLRVACGFDLNGRYPVLFNFPMLQTLHISGCMHLKWDLDILRGLPLLKELSCDNIPHTTGDIKSLRALKESMEKITIVACKNVTGNFMHLSDFPNLRELILEVSSLMPSNQTDFTGDIRNIGANDFPKLKFIALPSTVIGGHGYRFQHIADVPDLVNAAYSCLKRFTILFGDWCWELSGDSHEWYNSYPHYGVPQSPLCVGFVEVGSRLGWRWGNEGESCEINWLDPEPERHSFVSEEEQLQNNEEHERYTKELQLIGEEINVDVYRGYYQLPPSEEEYRRIAQPYIEEIEQRLLIGIDLD